MTEDEKSKIDAMTPWRLLREIRFTPAGEGWFAHQGCGEYICQRMTDWKNEHPEEWVELSKVVGWVRD